MISWFICCYLLYFSLFGLSPFSLMIYSTVQNFCAFKFLGNILLASFLLSILELGSLAAKVGKFGMGSKVYCISRTSCPGLVANNLSREWKLELNLEQSILKPAEYRGIWKVAGSFVVSSGTSELILSQGQPIGNWQSWMNQSSPFTRKSWISWEIYMVSADIWCVFTFRSFKTIKFLRYS